MASDFENRFKELKNIAKTNLANSIRNLAETSKFYVGLKDEIDNYKDQLNQELRKEGVILRIHQNIYSQIQKITDDVRDLHEKLNLLSKKMVSMTRTLGEATVKNRDIMNQKLDYLELMMPTHRTTCNEIKSSLAKLNKDILDYNKNVDSGKDGVKLSDTQKQELNQFFLKNTKKLIERAKIIHTEMEKHMDTLDNNRANLYTHTSRP
tara:strand:- start:519 stop:1142 length:624 start_codon:yes stop_codon:yes gene_type:complete